MYSWFIDLYSCTAEAMTFEHKTRGEEGATGVCGADRVRRWIM